MAYDNNSRGFKSDRPMFKGNWSCSKCGAPITELPFNPDPSRLDQLLCRDCHRKERQSRPFGDRPSRY